MLRVLFVDMNSFFASVEQQLRPELRARPVAVVAVDTDSTACLAASYEAKAHGVRTGTGVREARRMCPGLRIVVSRPQEYVRFHHRVLAAADTVLPVAGVHSIDEFSCRLLGAEHEPARARDLGERMKRAIKEQVGECMRCSVGVAPSRYLAKVAADMHKPDGLTMLEQRDLPQKLFSLALRDLPGVGPRMEQRLISAGVTSVEQICTMAKESARAAWGNVWGEAIWRWLHGEDYPEPPRPVRSIGHQHVLPPALRNDADARGVAVRLLHKAAARARHANYWARRMTVWVRVVGESGGWSGSAVFPECNDTPTLMETLAKLWSERPRLGAPLAVSVTLEDVVSTGSATERLFDETRRRDRLSKAMDRANLRHGRNSLHLGSMESDRHGAPTSIAFNTIPDLTLADMRDDEDRHMKLEPPDAAKEPKSRVRRKKNVGRWG